MNEKTLHLTLKKHWFDLMVNGQKKVEYRIPSKWIFSRLKDKQYKFVKFTNGYRKESPFFICEYLGYSIAEKNEVKKYGNYTIKVLKGDYMILLGDIVKK